MGPKGCGRADRYITADQRYADGMREGLAYLLGTPRDNAAAEAFIEKVTRT